MARGPILTRDALIRWTATAPAFNINNDNVEEELKEKESRPSKAARLYLAYTSNRDNRKPVGDGAAKTVKEVSICGAIDEPS